MLFFVTCCFPALLQACRSACTNEAGQDGCSNLCHSVCVLRGRPISGSTGFGCTKQLQWWGGTCGAGEFLWIRFHIRYSVLWGRPGRILLGSLQADEPAGIVVSLWYREAALLPMVLLVAERYFRTSGLWSLLPFPPKCV